MPSEEHYDDSAFSYFALSVLSVILVPTTFSYLKVWQKAFSTKYDGLCYCAQCQSKAKKIQIASRKPGCWGLTKFILWVLLWVLFVYLLQSASSSTPAEEVKEFDPYQILGLESGASADEIKRAYRKLSLIYHPDKNKDPGAEEMFISISKAYDTLTDPASREKWEKYGNPDGPRGIQSVGIALPSFLVSSDNSLLVLGIYVVVLVIIVPTVVICIWQRQKSLAPNQVSNKTMELFARAMRETHRFKKLIMILSLATEYKENIKLRRSDEPELRELGKYLDVEEEIKKSKKKQIAFEIYKNRRLFFIHFSRLYDKLSPNLRMDLDILLDKAGLLIAGLADISKMYGLVIPTVETFQMSQMIVQAVWNEPSRVGMNTDLLQLPHFNNEILKRLATRKYMKITKISEFTRLEPEKQKEILEGLMPLLTASNIKDIQKVCQLLPYDLDFTHKCLVEDDDVESDVTGGAIVTLQVVFERPSKPPTDKKPEDDFIEVHAPYFPHIKKEVWLLLLGDEKNRIHAIKRVDCIRDKLDISLKFQAPPKAGSHTYNISLICDSYAGFDKKKTFKLHVTKDYVPEKPKAPKKDGESDDSEDEDEEISQPPPEVPTGQDSESDSDED